MISPSSLTSILQTFQSADAKSLKPLLKLLPIEVVESLGKESYLLKIGDKQLSAFSKQPLESGEFYYAKLIQKPNTKPILSHLIKLPTAVLDAMEQPYVESYDLENLKHILQSKKNLKKFKMELLQKLSTSETKEQFQNLSHMLLSLHQNVLTLPLYIYERFAFFQLKKRYNKKTKKSFLDFYAFFSRLGPVSGVVDDKSVHLNVAYEEVAEFLSNNKESLPLQLTVTVSEKIEPLYAANEQRILDITI